MKSLIQSIVGSAKNLKSVPALAVSAMMTAIVVVLSFYTLRPTEFLKISFAFLPLCIIGALYGPVFGGLVGIAADLISYAISPAGPYFIGFTISGFLSGFIYGIFLYKKNVSLPRVIFAKLTISLFVQIGLNSVWLKLLYGTPIIAMMPTRLLKNAALLPIEVALMFTVLKALEKLTKQGRIPIK